VKVPAIVVVIVLVIVGYLVLRSVVSTLKFSAKMMTWAIVVLLVLGAAVFYKQRQNGEEPPLPLRSQQNSGFLLR
jgi:hypothetical protein